ncbi:hypothetical protein [Baekduia sp. Peel2402]|uniref:hypothetical protein n=1 Tax=Baekduia sp. Peel2402 TaxID=3458296 RepID=UPI00403EBB57
MTDSNGSAAPPEGLEGSLSVASRVLDELVVASSNPRPSLGFAGFRRPNHHVLTIAGGRGTGKTTLLHLLASAVSPRRDLFVLPPLEPEMFGPADTILGSTLARLQSQLLKDNPSIMHEATVKVRSLPEPLNVAQALDRLLRHSAFVRDGQGPGAVSPASLEQYSSDFARHALAGEGFTELWDATIAAIGRALSTGEGQAPAILVPVDDPDLSPGQLTRILQDIRLLATTPHVVVCVCLDLIEAHRALAASYAQALRVRPDSMGTASVVEAQLAKALPQRFRVSLTELTQRQRLAFTPLEAGRPPLAAILNKIEVPTANSQFSLGSLFWLHSDADDDMPSPYAKCLPGTARTLESLYFALAAQAEERNWEKAVRLILESAIEYGLQATPIPGYTARTLLSVEEPQDDRDRPILNLDFGPLRYARSTQDQRVLRIDPERTDRSIEIGSLGRNTYAIATGDSQNETQSAVDPALALGMVLAREFSHHADVYREELAGGEPVAGGGPSFFLNVRVGAFRGDRWFLLLPRWKSFYDYFAFDAIWRQSLTNADAVSMGLDIDPPELLHALVLSFLRTVGEVQMARTGTPLTRDEAERTMRPAAREHIAQIWAEVRTCLHDAACSDASAEARSAFLEWTSTFLPMACHPWILPQWLIDEILEARLTMLVAMGRAQARNFELSSILSRRIRANLGEEWITPLFGIFDGMPDMEIGDLRPAHLAAVEQRQKLQLRAAESGSSNELSSIALKVLREMLAEEEQQSEDGF